MRRGRPRIKNSPHRPPRTWPPSWAAFSFSGLTKAAFFGNFTRQNLPGASAMSSRPWLLYGRNEGPPPFRLSCESEPSLRHLRKPRLRHGTGAWSERALLRKAADCFAATAFTVGALMRGRAAHSPRTETTRKRPLGCSTAVNVMLRCLQ